MASNIPKLFPDPVRGSMPKFSLLQLIRQPLFEDWGSRVSLEPCTAHTNVPWYIPVVQTHGVLLCTGLAPQPELLHANT
jgi:hypothetical protein